MIIYIKKKDIFILLMLLLFLSLTFILIKFIKNQEEGLIAGGIYNKIDMEKGHEKESMTLLDYEKYFRPSNLPILNTKKEGEELINYYNEEGPAQINLPKKYFQTPEDTVLNYFSLLREAANPVEGKYVGCGSLGSGKGPYKVAYNFLSKEYREKVSFKNYEDSFKNILHINLIKLKKVETSSDEIRYFYEIETIQGSDSHVANFVYYYGFINLSKFGDEYKISNISIIPEDYLCAPYHGWIYDGEAKVNIEYGEWCNLVKNIEKVDVDGYVKNIYFKGRDNKNYKIQFYILTNDYDIEVNQYIENTDGSWKRISLNPSQCLENKQNLR